MMQFPMVISNSDEVDMSMYVVDEIYKSFGFG